MINNLVCIDPGFDGTGWAYWPSIPEQGERMLSDRKRWITPGASGVVRLTPRDRERSWLTRMILIGDRFGQVLDGWPPVPGETRVMVAEMPEFYGASAVSHAASVKGDLGILTALTGSLLRVAWDRGWVVVTLSPTEWKGQMNKKVLAVRIGKALGKVYPNHEADAVGMGLHLSGDL